MSCKNEKKEQPKDANVNLQTNSNPQNTSQQGKDIITENKKKLNTNPIYNSKIIKIENVLINGQKVILLKMNLMQYILKMIQ